VHAADYPEKPVTLVVPFAAGGPTDKVARDLAEALRKPLGGQAIIIENVGGAGGTLGATKVAKAAPDGYTLLLHHIGMATSPALYRNLQFKTLDDFEYLGMINEVPMTLVGRPNLPANNYAELAKWIEANKGKVNLANASLGAASHLCGLLFMTAIQTDLTTVPYKGTAPAINDLLGGQVSLMFSNPTSTVPHVKSGKLRALGVMDAKRNPSLPDVPTALEAGLPELSNVIEWYGVVVPAATPPGIVQRLSGAVLRAMAAPDVVERVTQIGQTPSPAGAEAFARLIREDHARWQRVVKTSGARAE
jgi:tripartite-type tricarboxylate transporter receptor subunit TctC